MGRDTIFVLLRLVARAARANGARGDASVFIRAGAFRGWAAPSLVSPALSALLRDPEGTYTSILRPFTKRTGRTVARCVATAVLPVDGTVQTVLVKHGRYRGLLAPWIHWVHAQFMAGPWIVGRWARARGVPTPAVLGFVRARPRGGRAESLFLQEYVAGAATLLDEMRAANAHAPRRAMLSAVGGAVRRAHDAGLFHGELHPRNVLVGGDQGEPILLTDLTRAAPIPRWPAFLGRLARAIDLARFYRSLTRHGSLADCEIVQAAYAAATPRRDGHRSSAGTPVAGRMPPPD